MMKYCDACGKEVQVKTLTKREIFNVCGEDIEADVQVMVCADCGEEIFDEELDSATLIHAYNEYRKRHKLLLPEEIRKIREQYGLSQRSFAKLLNWGDKTINRYENGSIQDKAHNSLLLFLRKPENMRSYLAENEVMLDDKQKEKLIRTVDKLEMNKEYRNGSGFFELLFSKEPCEENGFKSFDYEKFCAMVLYFANRNSELLKTKLMKLLNYSDMIYFKENGVSISGLVYVHLPYGPVPDNFDILIGKMTEDHIVHIDVIYENGFEKHQVIPDCEIDESVLSADEIKVLERIYEKFRDFGSAEISEYSHQEKGYRETETGKVISYAYAEDIQLK